MSFISALAFFPNRAAVKQRSRDRDAARIRAGQVSASQLRLENGFASSLPLAAFRIGRIGKRRFKAVRAA